MLTMLKSTRFEMTFEIEECLKNQLKSGKVGLPLMKLNQIY